MYTENQKGDIYKRLFRLMKDCRLKMENSSLPEEERMIAHLNAENLAGCMRDIDQADDAMEEFAYDAAQSCMEQVLSGREPEAVCL